MPLYRMTDEEFEELEETSFGAEGIYERYDLQRMLRDQADVLEEGLFILSEEYGDWVESSRRIDLLGLDANGSLVVVELKREDQDSLMDLQAVRYAAMVANMTSEQAIGAHQSYLQARGIEGDAESRFRDHLKSYEEEVSISTHNPRIILASANFSTELTTSVLWLNQVGLDITCVKLQPYSVEGTVVRGKNPDSSHARIGGLHGTAERPGEGGPYLKARCSFQPAVATLQSRSAVRVRSMWGNFRGCTSSPCRLRKKGTHPSQPVSAETGPFCESGSPEWT